MLIHWEPVKKRIDHPKIPHLAPVDPPGVWHPAVHHHLIELGGRYAHIARRFLAREATWRQIGQQVLALHGPLALVYRCDATMRCVPARDTIAALRSGSEIQRSGISGWNGIFPTSVYWRPLSELRISRISATISRSIVERPRVSRGKLSAKNIGNLQRSLDPHRPLSL